MAQNPLQQFFRQPKVFIGLPSAGAYLKPGSIQGDPTHMPVYGMTGMDEIILKTPDALLAGESTVKVIESCCSNIKDAWDISVIDMDIILAAIRIATYGNTMSVTHTCPTCSTDNEYDIDLTKIIEFFATCKYNNSIVLDGLTIKIRPLTYKESTDFSQRNFQIRQQLVQANEVESDDERTKLMTGFVQDLAMLQNEIFTAGVESVEANGQVVSERQFIKEWIENSDKVVFDKIKERYFENQNAWTPPATEVICESCGATNKIAIDLDQSSFFGNA